MTKWLLLDEKMLQKLLSTQPPKKLIGESPNEKQKRMKRKKGDCALNLTFVQFAAQRVA